MRALGDDLRDVLGQALSLRLGRVTVVAGGDIHQAFRLSSLEGRDIFAKASVGAPGLLFRREAEGLAWLGETGALPVPQVLAHGESTSYAGETFGYLALEYLPPTRPSSQFDELLGEGLARLHQVSDGPPGLDRDNFIGPLGQSNRSHPSWPAFYAEERLLPLATRLIREGKAPGSWGPRFEALARSLDGWVPDGPVSRLHGDLWSGNVHSGPGGSPFLIDPAVYRGHREVDLAMMGLFGGFSARTFAAYGASAPLEAGFEERLALYQLYPLLVHALLFGSSYVRKVDETLRNLR